MQGGAVEAGKRVADRLLVASPKWKPIYGDLLAEMVPIGWMAPGEEEMTSEELERWMEKFNKERERIDERRRKQKEVRENLKAEVGNVQSIRDEL